MNMKKFPIFAFYALVMAVLFVFGPDAQAQSLGLAPAEVRETFKPGVPFQLELSTVNNGNTAVEMNVQITDLWYNEKNEKIFTTPGTSPHSAANWIQFVPEHFEVPAHGTQKMRAIVTPPSDAKGGYYAVLFVESKPAYSFDDKKTGQQVFTNVRLGCLVQLTAEKTEEFKIELSNIKLTPPGVNRGLDVDFDLLNGGNTHIHPIARVGVLDVKHKLVAKAESEEKRFLPGQNNSMHVAWAGSLPAGDYTAVLTVTYGNDRIETKQVPFSVTKAQ